MQFITKDMNVKQHVFTLHIPARRAWIFPFLVYELSQHSSSDP